MKDLNLTFRGGFRFITPKRIKRVIVQSWPYRLVDVSFQFKSILLMWDP